MNTLAKIIILSVVLGLSTASISPIKLTRSADLDLMQFLIQSRDASQGNPTRTLDCFDYYVPKLNSITASYEREYAQCVEEAENKRLEIDSAYQPQRDLIEGSRISACDALQTCSGHPNSVDYFECYERTGIENSKVLYDISISASDNLVDVHEQYRLIDNSENRCTEVAERKYVDDTATTYIELQDCLQGKATVPPPQVTTTVDPNGSTLEPTVQTSETSEQPDETTTEGSGEADTTTGAPLSTTSAPLSTSEPESTTAASSEPESTTSGEIDGTTAAATESDSTAGASSQPVSTTSGEIDGTTAAATDSDSTTGASSEPVSTTSGETDGTTAEEPSEPETTAAPGISTTEEPSEPETTAAPGISTTEQAVSTTEEILSSPQLRTSTRNSDESDEDSDSSEDQLPEEDLGDVRQVQPKLYRTFKGRFNQQKDDK